MVVRVGEKIPDFEFEALHEGEIKKLRFSDFQGKYLVVFFYPADFTFICPTELKELAENYDEIKKIGAEVISMSTDTVYVHKAWQDTSETIRKIKFPMGADPTGKIARAFGVYLENEGVSLRATFIVDPEGIVKSIEINDNSIGRSAKELIRKIQATKYVKEHAGEVCPASWEPGKETLKPSLELVGKI